MINFSKEVLKPKGVLVSKLFMGEDFIEVKNLVKSLEFVRINIFSKTKINPLIGAAGVSAVPMAARVVNKVGLEYNSQNHLLMHAMGPNIAGVIGSAVAAGVMIKFLS